MAATSTVSPVCVNFLVRQMDFSFSETPRYWWDGQPFMAQFMNNLSSLFPYGEKFFVDSMRTVYNRLEDPQLKKDVSVFIGQGVVHSKEHVAYNEYAEEYGVDLERLELRIKALLEDISKVTTGKHQLAVTYTLEYFTATMVARLFKHRDSTIQMQLPKMYKLWMWHAIEESEYENVAYDVCQKVYGGYFTRVLVMMLTTPTFFGVVGWFQLDLLRKDSQLFNWRSWKRGLGTLLGLRKGFFTYLLLPYPDYYRPGFHPSNHNTAKLEKCWKDKLAFADWSPPPPVLLRPRRQAPPDVSYSRKE